MTSNPFLPTVSGLAPNAGIAGTPGAITAPSTTSATIGTGSFSFNVPSQAAWAAGMFISVVDAANSANYMLGTVTSYSGNTLVFNSTATGGSGTKTSWLINLCGTAGPQGPTGATGATGSAGTSAGPVTSAVQGLKIVNNSGTPNTKVSITAMLVSLINGSGVSVFKSAYSVTVDLTTGTSTAAANGMDGEARGTSAWIYLYAISNGSGTFAGLATKTSPLSGAPTMPSGYSYSAYLGAMYVDSSGNLMQTMQLGKSANYIITAATNTAAAPVLATAAGGAVGNPATPTFVAVALGAFVPASAARVKGFLFYGHDAFVCVAPNNSYGAYNSTTNPPPIVTDIGTVSDQRQFDFLIESSNIYWATFNTAPILFCTGWEDYCVVT